MIVMDRGGGGGGAVDDMGEGMQCSDHPYRNNPGGICGFCLQEKLGKLLSSSNPSFFPALPTSSSSSSSFRSSEGGGGAVLGLTTATTTSTSSVSVRPSLSSNNTQYRRYHHHNRIPFLLAQKKHKKADLAPCESNVVLNRCKSSTAPNRQFLDADDYNPCKRGFWSFLHLSTKRRSHSDRDSKPSIHPAITSQAAIKDKAAVPSSSKKADYGDENESPNSSHALSSGRKVARSRSVGCGSRSFSGDFLERISTGFGDCTLRRVESHRETKPKIVMHGDVAAEEHQRIKERVRCGGIFRGFSMSSSYSSSYWLPEVNGRTSAAAAEARGTPHSRSRSWGWAFASPMRALTRPSKEG
ncbi:PREDICTED: uncharacterized protein LOC104591946 [Nelumbo nucifera]|uniref:Uncharacterized protein LOC104591946 n=2 Tax=Nelumbo nucifera TaxID=4432 RepID=A0A1U7Z7Q6_NELNU|nr:PREDICTED: uncharacterized protein LOC104591946 [Nelumbo nucifera]DAD30323.1 TPA_asm: hypothetical protein HUJ06_009174 [Nelumbo nucifera]